MSKKKSKKLIVWSDYSLVAVITFALAIISFAFLFLTAFSKSSFNFYGLIFGTGATLNKPVVTLIIVFAIAVINTIAAPLYGIIFKHKYYLGVVGSVYIIVAIFLFCTSPIASAEGAYFNMSMFGAPVASTTGGVFFILTGALALGYNIFTVLYSSKK